MKKVKGILCVLLGHSKIQSSFWGYYYCGRCGDQVGDSLGSVYPQASTVVVIGHNCKTCRDNYKKLTLKDKLLTPNPFKAEVELNKEV